MKVKPKAILFDLDETILDRKKSVELFIGKLINQFFYDSHNHKRIIDCFIRADMNGYRSKRDVYGILKETLKWSKETTEEEYLDFWNRIFPDCLQSMEHVNEMLDFFKEENISLGVVTNGSEKLQKTKLEKLHITEYFQSIIISEVIGIKKPDPRIFQFCLEELNVKPDEAWFVGDNPNVDIVGGRNAGMFTIQLLREGNALDKEIKPEIYIHSLQELTQIFRTM